MMEEVNTIELERIKYAAFMYISNELAKEFAIKPNIEVTNQLDWMFETIVIRIRQDILGKSLDRVEIRYPANWWQSFKQRWFSNWMLKRWPIIETIQVVDVKALYPTLNIPVYKPIINVWQSEHSSKFYNSEDYYV